MMQITGLKIAKTRKWLRPTWARKIFVKSCILRYCDLVHQFQRRRIDSLLKIKA